MHLSYNSKQSSFLQALLKIFITASLCLLFTAALAADDSNAALVEEFEAPIKFSLTSDAWGENVNSSIRFFANNVSQQDLVFHSLSLAGDAKETRLNPEGDDYFLDITLAVRSGAWAEQTLDYIDMSYGTDCVEDALHGEESNWKLVEISNYSLNPSVRSRIIENTDSFRIFSCPRQVNIKWASADNDQNFEEDIWVLYHFESRTTQ